MPKARLRNGDIYYEAMGDGPPLFLVPGLGGVGSYWQPQAVEFSRSFRVITHDHRGTGQSSRSDISYSVEQMTEDLIGLMDHLNIDRASIVGHSTGGAIGQVMALEHAERVEKLVLYATWTKCDAFMRRVFDCRKALLACSGPAEYIRATSFLLYPDWWINQNASELDAADEALALTFPSAAIAISRCDAVVNFDREKDLAQISTPTLVFCAEDDFLIPAYFARRLAAAIPHAMLTTIPRGGHACSQTMPAEFATAILPFLLENSRVAPDRMHLRTGAAQDSL